MSSVAAAAAAVLEVFLADFAPSVVFAGAFEAVAVDAGALPAVEAGLGPICIDNVGQRGNEHGRKKERLWLSMRDQDPLI